MLWTDNDFDSLPRLGELYTLDEFKENVCQGETFIDSVTAESLYYYFLTRKVCSVETMQVKGGETVNYFELFFRRHLQKYSPQYLQYLRVQTTEIDPMVTQYMERLIDRVNVNSRKTERSNTDTTSGTNKQTTNTNDSRNGTQNVTENTSGDKTTGGNTSETTGTPEPAAQPRTPPTTAQRPLTTQPPKPEPRRKTTAVCTPNFPRVQPGPVMVCRVP